ncbi:hypothetical protein AAY80_212 [Stenotrophomonas phage vB_SmaS-DLP_6]|nr:hypothetical protein AAY80_212 [Stenotrophomonas phage vB_SmaS-DLP_6]
MFGPKTFKYKFHLTNGSVIVVKGVTKLRIVRGGDGRLTEYGLTFSSPSNNTLFHVSPIDIVAIEEI